MSLAKLNFQHHYSSLQSHMSPQKLFEYADLLLKKHFLLLSMLKTYFVETQTFGMVVYVSAQKAINTLVDNAKQGLSM